jgi:hypothetical protein
MEEASKSYKLINKEKKNKKSENTSDMDDINNDVNNLLKLGVTSIPKLKPKKKRKNKKKNKKSTVKSEKVTMVKKNTGTFEKVTNFIKSHSTACSVAERFNEVSYFLKGSCIFLYHSYLF